MTVTYQPFNVGHGLPLVTTFSDTFNRASGSVGNNWFSKTRPATPTVDPIDSCTFAIGAGTGGQALLLSSIGNNNPNTVWQAGIFELPARAGTIGKPIQFVQWTWIQSTGPTGIEGPAVFIDDNTWDMYIVLLGQTGIPFLRRVNQGTMTNLTNLNGGIALGANTVIRLSADSSTAGQVTLITSFNGVVSDTTVDNNANRLAPGYTGGLYVSAMSLTGGVTSASQWRNFSCGLGL